MLYRDFYGVEGIPLGINHTITVIPENEADPDEIVSGYLRWSGSLNITEDTEIEIELGYFEYVAPTSGDIFGKVTYDSGPMDGEDASGALVEILDADGTVIAAALVSGTSSTRNLSSFVAREKSP